MLLKKEARSKKTSTSRLEELARCANSSVQLAVAGNPNTSAATLEFLSGYGKYTILKAVAKNSNVSQHILEKLARHRQVSVREAVTLAPMLTEIIALELAKDSEEEVRYCLANRVHRTQFQWHTGLVAEVFVQDVSLPIRLTTARNCKHPHIVEKLIKDQDNAVLIHALANPFLPLNSLTRCLDILFDTLNIPDYWLQISNIALRSDLPWRWLERLACHPDPKVRWSVAFNPNTPHETMLLLARDSNPIVWAAAAESYRLPEEIYWDYARCSYIGVRLALLRNHSIPQALIEFLANDQDILVARKAKARL